MEFALLSSMSRTLILGTVCSCLFLTSCSSDDDPVKSYSNYQITVNTASPVSFNALGETKTITVSATKEICWDGKPSGEKETVKVTASIEGDQFILESSQNDATLQLQITAKENETEEILKGKVIITLQDDGSIETQTVELNQDAATVEFGSYKIVFAEDNVSLPYMGGKGSISFTCQRGRLINGKLKGEVPYSLNGVKYEASQFNDIAYRITKDGEETGKYILEYDQPQSITLHEIDNSFTFVEENGKDKNELASFHIFLAANPNGEDLWFVSEILSGVYQGK